MDEQGAQTAAAVLTQCTAAFKFSTFDYAGIEAEIADQLFAGREAIDVADDRNQGVGGDQVESGELIEPQEVRLLFDLQSHHAAQALPAFTCGNEAAVHFLQQEFLSRTPFFEAKQSMDRFGPAEAEPFGQTQSVFVKEAAQMLLSASAVFDAALIGGQQLTTLTSLRVGLPDFDRQWRVTLCTTRALSGSRPLRIAAAKVSGWMSRPTARPLGPSAGCAVVD